MANTDLNDVEANNLKYLLGKNDSPSIGPTNYNPTLNDDDIPYNTPIDQNSLSSSPLVGNDTASSQSSLNQNDGASSWQPISNFLHDYPTYTYGISLSALTTDDYNNLMAGTYTPNNVLIASAGRHSTDFKRHPFWQNDFYFEDLNLESIIGTPASGKGSNVVSLDFTIVEPYGITFLDLLVLTAQNIGVDNYLKIPYLLQIDFFGYDENNLNPQQIPNTQRRIPVYFTGVEISFNENGTTYKISAIPYNYLSFMDQASTVGFVAKLRGEKTKTGGILLSSLLSTNDTDAKNIVNDAQARLKEDYTLPKKSTPGDTNADNQNRNPQFSSAGLGTLLNAYYQFMSILDYGEDIPPYRFKFTLKDLDGSTNLANTELYEDDLKALTTSLTSISSENVKAALAKEQANKGSTVVQSKAGVDITFPAGMQILEILSQLLKYTTYFRSQIKKDKKAAENTNPLDFFKVSPQITLGKHIASKNDYQKIIEFVITPYKKYGNKFDFAPTGRPKLTDCVKEYDYLYTGKNSDITDLKVQFNTAYYTQYTFNPTRTTKDTDQAVQQPDATTDNQKTSSSVAVDSKKFLISNQGVPSAPGSTVHVHRDEISVRVGDMFANIYQSSRADMLSIDMSILGDPAYIQEEDFIYSSGSSLLSSSDPRLTKSGSLYVNKGDVLIHINFRMPQDINTDRGDPDEGTFSFNKPIRLGSSMFSGIYQVIQVRSTFSKGTFIQQLNLVRMTNDPYSDLEATQNVTTRDQG